MAQRMVQLLGTQQDVVTLIQQLVVCDEVIFQGARRTVDPACSPEPFSMAQRKNLPHGPRIRSS